MTPGPRSLQIRVSLVVAIAAGLAALGGLDARATHGSQTTGDEPYYLLTAISLAEDGDLDVSDELGDERFLPFHEIPLDRQTVPRGPEGRRVSPHDPGLAVLLAPAMAIDWRVARAIMVLLAAATAGMAAHLAQRRLGAGWLSTLMIVGGGFVGFPVAAYGTQIYPEMPAALLVTSAVVVLTRSRPRIWWPLAAVVALPWLSIKYAPVAGVLALAALAVTWRRERSVVSLLGPIAVLAAGGVVFVAGHLWSYGGVTAYAAGDHFVESGQLGVVGDVNLLARSRRLVGLLVDRGFGLAAWSPVWLLFPVMVGAVAEQIVRKREAFWHGAGPQAGAVSAAVVVAGWLTATFVALTMHGWWVPGRQVIVVVPVALALMAATGSRVVEGVRVPMLAVGSVALAVAAGAVTWLWLAVEASTGRRTLVVDPGATGAPAYRWLQPVWPDGTDVANTSADVHLAAWALLCTALVLAGWRLSGLAGRSLGDSHQDAFGREGAEADGLAVDLDGGRPVG